MHPLTGVVITVQSLYGNWFVLAKPV